MRLALLMRVMVGSALVFGLISASGVVAATKSASSSEDGKKKVAMAPKKAMKKPHHDKQMTPGQRPIDPYWEKVYREQREPSGGQ